MQSLKSVPLSSYISRVRFCQWVAEKQELKWLHKLDKAVSAKHIAAIVCALWVHEQVNSVELTWKAWLLVWWLSLRGRAWASSKHNDLLICHCRKQDLSRTSIYLGITYAKPTARTATVSASTYARTKLYTKVISYISDVISAVYADGSYLKRPQPPL